MLPGEFQPPGASRKNIFTESEADQTPLYKITLTVWANISCVTHGVKLSPEKDGVLLILLSRGDRLTQENQTPF
jgi:hypothetical protein